MNSFGIHTGAQKKTPTVPAAIPLANLYGICRLIVHGKLKARNPTPTPIFAQKRIFLPACSNNSFSSTDNSLYISDFPLNKGRTSIFRRMALACSRVKVGGVRGGGLDIVG